MGGLFLKAYAIARIASRRNVFSCASRCTVGRTKALTEVCGLRGWWYFQAMAEVGMPLLIHGEVTTPGVDIFDKEARFIEEVIKVNIPTKWP